MNRNQLIVISVVLLLLIGGAIAFFLLRETPVQGPDSSNPFGGLSGDNPGGTPITNYDIVGADGEAYPVPDFRAGKDPIAGIDGNYYDLVHTGGPLFGDEGDRFYIQFDETNSSFTISLVTEPLGESRLLSEDFLRSTLKLSDSQLCKLKVNVGVPRELNQIYGSYENLGLSFCPGAVPLP